MCFAFTEKIIYNFENSIKLKFIPCTFIKHLELKLQEKPSENGINPVNDSVLYFVNELHSKKAANVRKKWLNGIICPAQMRHTPYVNQLLAHYPKAMDQARIIVVKWRRTHSAFSYLYLFNVHPIYHMH